MPFATMRAMTSAGPPAAKGTVNITGLDGKSCAAACPTSAQPSHNRLKIRYIKRPLDFQCSDFFAARTVNGVGSARPEKLIERTRKYASSVRRCSGFCSERLKQQAGSRDYFRYAANIASPS